MQINKKKLAEIKKVLKKYDVQFAFLFGSRAQGTALLSSDYDIAVFLPKKIKKEKRFYLRLKLIGEIGRIVGSQEKIDLVVLNDTQSVLLKFSVIKGGVLIYQKDYLARLNFELRTMSDYYDFSPFVDAYNRAFTKHVLNK